MPRRASRFAQFCLGALLASWGSTTALWSQPTFMGNDAERVTFFPPDSPPYGALIDTRPAYGATLFNGMRLDPPDGLGDFVSEHFYPQLSTRLFAAKLSRKLNARLEAHRVQRTQLANALLEQLHLLQAAEPATRGRELRAFAETQKKALVELEQEAEELRAQLIDDGILTFSVDWNKHRAWKVGQTVFARSGYDKEAEFQVLRAAAFYAEGFGAQQRAMLREITAEQRHVARKARGVLMPRGSDELTAIFFLPEMAQMRMPRQIPATLYAKIGRFNGEKAALKRELVETVLKQDVESTSRRTEAFAALTAQQWPKLVALEKLAEEIREDLAALPEAPPPPAPPSIPPALMEEINAFNAARDAYFSELEERVQRALARVPRPSILIDSDARVRAQREYNAARMAARREAIEQFQRDNNERFEMLARKREEIRSLLSAVASAQKDPKTGAPLNADTLLETYMESMRAFDRYGREDVIYRNYRTAMLEPGLSPEQRRLLFGITLINLAQPLPNGEVMPLAMQAMPTPRS